MNGLDSAKRWFEGELARLRHVQELSENHDQEPHLRELLGALLRLKKGERKLWFKAEREDLLAHGGFHQNIAHTSPEDAYDVLRRALQLLAQSQSNCAL